MPGEQALKQKDKSNIMMGEKSLLSIDANISLFAVCVSHHKKINCE